MREGKGADDEGSGGGGGGFLRVGDGDTGMHRGDLRPAERSPPHAAPRRPTPPRTAPTRELSCLVHAAGAPNEAATANATTELGREGRQGQL